MSIFIRILSTFSDLTILLVLLLCGYALFSSQLVWSALNDPWSKFVLLLCATVLFIIFNEESK